MTDESAPEQASYWRTYRRQLITLIVIVVLVAAPFVGGWLFGDSKDEPSLCDLMRSGWTGDEIANSDEWRDWPASTSLFERNLIIAREAGRDCPEQIGL
jgi:hypothetical protein